MNDTEYKSIKEISLEIGVVKQTIRNYINTEPLKSELQPHIKHIGNRILIHSDGIKLIKLFNEKGNLADLSDLGVLADNLKDNLANLADLADLGDNEKDNLVDLSDLGDNAKSNLADLGDKRPQKNTLFDGEIIKILQENILVLQKQLDVKDKQLEVRDKQIEELTATIRIQAESINAAHHNELAETIIDSQANTSKLSDGKAKRPFWQFWKK